MLKFFHILKGNLEALLDEGFLKFKFLDREIGNGKKDLEEFIKEIFTKEEKEILKTRLLVFDKMQEILDEIEAKESFFKKLADSIFEDIESTLKHEIINKLTVIALLFHLSDRELFEKIRDTLLKE